MRTLYSSLHVRSLVETSCGSVSARKIDDYCRIMDKINTKLPGPNHRHHDDCLGILNCFFPPITVRQLPPLGLKLTHPPPKDKFLPSYTPHYPVTQPKGGK